MDLEALVTDELRDELRAYTLEWFDVDVSNRRPPHARVAIRTPDGEEALGDFTGDGPVDAIFRAINAATRRDARLREFRIDAVTGGQDALGEASVVLELAGQSAAGQGVSTDIIEAAGRCLRARALATPCGKAARRASAEAPSREVATERGPCGRRAGTRWSADATSVRGSVRLYVITYSRMAAADAPSADPASARA